MSQPRVEAQALSQVLQMRLGSLLDAVEFIDVDVQTDLSQIIQGEANSVSVEGQGLVMQFDIRIQNIELQTDNIAKLFSI
ncbi:MULTISPECIES: LmeA family phospholipid-binding protein [Cyanophyceae]|uniref:LmeA family phospholipid-binding protein n=1 Tax=Cyanophyceae TaxID=3028117 RepID=UPI001681EE7C|nr:LmeA family phospholipid-binding protein [Trichocoleus sp. FACHB-40]MBD2005639.1 LmeA family phospholipid-binding protein [Trichocoleus sp. FACHB-40]